MVSLSGEEKCALLLKSLAPEVTEKILVRLGVERGTRLRALMSQLQAGPQTQKMLAELLDEVRQAVRQPRIDITIAAPLDTPLRIAPETAGVPVPPATKTDVAPLAGSNAARDTAKPTPGLSPLPSLSDGLDPLKALTLMPADRLAMVLEAEPARTVGIILNYLEGDKAGEIFRRLPSNLRAEISVQFAAQGMPPLEVLRRMADALVQKCKKLQDRPAFPEGEARLRKMADMLRLLDRAQRQEVLSAMEDRTPEVASHIKAMMYRFEDVQRLDNRSMQKILKEIDTRNLAVALRDASDAIRERILQNLSRRAQENLSEEIELARGAPRGEVQQAQTTIAQIIQRLDLAGELVMTE